MYDQVCELLVVPASNDQDERSAEPFAVALKEIAAEDVAESTNLMVRVDCACAAAAAASSDDTKKKEDGKEAGKDEGKGG